MWHRAVIVKLQGRGRADDDDDDAAAAADDDDSGYDCENDNHYDYQTERIGFKIHI